MVVQLREPTKNHSIVYSKRVDCVEYELYLNKIVIKEKERQQ